MDDEREVERPSVEIMVAENGFVATAEGELFIFPNADELCEFVKSWAAYLIGENYAEDSGGAIGGTEGKEGGVAAGKGG